MQHATRQGFPSALALAALAALSLGACVASSNPTALSVRPTQRPVVGAASGTLRFLVSAPKALAVSGAAAMANEAKSTLFNGGGILTDAGSGYRLAAIATGEHPRTVDATVVGKAQVRLVGLDGAPIGEVATANDQGLVTLLANPKGGLSVALSAFVVGGKVYRQAVLVGTGEPPSETIAIDPINTMIEAWVRATLAGGGQVSPLDLARLKRAWVICAKSGVQVPPNELEAATDKATATAQLVRRWQQVLASGVADPAEAAELKAFAASVKGSSATPSPDAGASADAAATP